MALIIAVAMWCVTASGSSPEPAVYVKRVLAIEVNRYACQPDGSGGSWQVIYWDDIGGERRVRHWRGVQGPEACDVMVCGDGWCEWRWLYGSPVVVYAREAYETWSERDPEVDDRLRGTEHRRDIWR